MSGGTHTLGQVLNEAVRIKPSSNASEPKSGHVTFAEMFWESLSSKERQQEVVEELNQIMNYLLTQTKRDARTERAVWFVSFVFGRMLDATDESMRSSANAFLNTLCDRSHCENKTVRFRSSQCIRMALEPLPDQPEVDESVAAAVYATLLARTRDRSYDVRTQALLALDRFKIPGEDNQYNQDQVTAVYLASLRTDPHPNPRSAVLSCLPLTQPSIEAICERTRDVGEIVRAHAIKEISARILPQAMGKQRTGDVVCNGLNDRSDRVRCLAEGMLLTWFEHTFEENVLFVFEAFDSETHGDVFPKVMDVLLRKKLDKVVVWSETWKFELASQSDSLSVHSALFWRTLLCGCKRRGDILGREAATDEEKASESQTLFDVVDRILPSSFIEFLSLLQELLDRQCIAQCRHFLEILTDCFNFTDEGDQQIASELYQKLCLHVPQQECPEWHASVISFGHVVWPDPTEFFEATMTPLKDMTESFGEFSDTCEGEATNTYRHWLFLTVEMLRTVPLRTPHVQALGLPSFTIADVLRFLKSAAQEIHHTADLHSWIIEGIGICLALRLTHEEHEACMPVVWNALESSNPTTASASVKALCHVAMLHGARRIDQRPPAPAVSKSFRALWDCRIFEASAEDASLPIHFMNMLHWEQDLHVDVKNVVVESICQLLLSNNVHQHSGIGIGECIQCLCPLVALFVYEEESEEQNAYMLQYLRVFFDCYAQSHILHQYLFRAGFIPIARYCLDLANVTRLSVAPVVKFLANLLLAPVHSANVTEVELEKSKTEIADQNVQLMCLLLWEISQCPSGFHSSKSYVSALWKVVMDLKIEGSGEVVRIQAQSLLEDCADKGKLPVKQLDSLKSKLCLSEGFVPLTENELGELVDKLESYTMQLGTHLFSEQEDDD